MLGKICVCSSQLTLCMHHIEIQKRKQNFAGMSVATLKQQEIRYWFIHESHVLVSFKIVKSIPTNFALHVVELNQQKCCLQHWYLTPVKPMTKNDCDDICSHIIYIRTYRVGA